MTWLQGHRCCALNDLVDEAIVFGFLRGKPLVTVSILFNLFDALAGVERSALGHHALQINDLLGVDRNVAGLALHLTGRLVHENATVREGKTFARCTSAEEELPHRSGHTDTNGRNVAGYELHGVVDAQAVGNRATGLLM